MQLYSLPENAAYNPYATVTEDGKHLVISVSEGYNANAVHIMDSDDPDDVVRLMDQFFLQGREETLRDRVVPAVALTAHAALNSIAT